MFASLLEKSVKFVYGCYVLLIIIHKWVKKIMISADIAFVGARIYSEGEILDDGLIAVKKSKIHSISSRSRADFKAEQVFTLPSNWHVIPGFIDMHIHGAYGADVMDASHDALATISRSLPREGVTSFLATTIAKSCDNISAALSNVRDYQSFQSSEEDRDGAGLLGVYLECPFISPGKAGAQSPQHILKPDVVQLKKWHAIAGDSLKVVTFAPEVAGNVALMEYALQHQIVAAIGHTNATYEDIYAVLQQLAASHHGFAAHATHLFNAMPPLAHRAPGAVAALLLDAAATVELIADGLHLHPAILKLALKLKGKDKVILVSDAMRAKGFGDGHYEFGGQNVNVVNNTAYLDGDGVNKTLAGSVLKMDAAVRNMMKFTGCPLADTIQMVSMNPAHRLGVAARKGSLAVGKDADVVVLDENYNVMLTMCAGRIIFVTTQPLDKDA